VLLRYVVIYACSHTAAVELELITQLIPTNWYEASGQGLLMLIRGLGFGKSVLSTKHVS